MLTDDIKQNIMKYLNNGVSGSSQEQKPVVSSTIYNFESRYFNTSNTITTDDNNFLVNIGYGRNSQNQQVFQMRIWNIEKTTKENPEPYAILEIPQYNNMPVYSVGDYIGRDEDGRFYSNIWYGTEQNYAQYFVIFNDAITDGVLLVNKAYKLSDIPIERDTYLQGTLNNYSHVMKLKGKGEYIFFNYRTNSTQVGQWAGQYRFYVSKLIINVGEELKTKTWGFNIKNETDDQYLATEKMSINTDGDIPFILMQYYTTYIKHGENPYTIEPTNYAIGKIYLEEDSSNDYTTTILKNIYTNNSYTRLSDFGYRAFNTNGLYIQDVIKNYTNNVLTLRYVLVTPDGVKQNIAFPSTFSITNFDNDNTSITDTFIILGLFGDTNIKYLYKIDTTNNRIVYVDDLSTLSTAISTAEIVTLKQFNLYFCYSFLVLPKAFIIKDVPVYGRATLPKQKLFNSAIFRAIKKYRNRRANI